MTTLQSTAVRSDLDVHATTYVCHHILSLNLQVNECAE
jgi:hypothetical protein